MRFLFVCDDNIRSSPMAAAFLYHEHRRRRIQPLIVASAGFGPSGQPIDASVVTLLDDRGVDLSRKRTRELDAGLVERADLIATMTGAQANRVMVSWPEVAGRVFTLRHLCAQVAARPAEVSAAAWVHEATAVPRTYAPGGDPAWDIAEPVGAEFGATLNLADQLLAATGHLAEWFWSTPSQARSNLSRQLAN